VRSTCSSARDSPRSRDRNPIGRPCVWSFDRPRTVDRMRAVVVTEPGDPEVMRVEDVPDATPGPGEVLIKVAATAVNRADCMQRQGNYPPPRGASDYLGVLTAQRNLLLSQTLLNRSATGATLAVTFLTTWFPTLNSWRMKTALGSWEPSAKTYVFVPMKSRIATVPVRVSVITTSAGIATSLAPLSRMNLSVIASFIRTGTMYVPP